MGPLRLTFMDVPEELKEARRCGYLGGLSDSPHVCLPLSNVAVFPKTVYLTTCVSILLLFCSYVLMSSVMQTVHISFLSYVFF